MTHLGDDIEGVNVCLLWYLSIELAIMGAYKVLVHYLSVFLWTICLLDYVTSYHVKCRFPKGSIRGVLKGLEGYEECSNFLNRCGGENIKILIYENCYVGYLSLPIEKIQMNYPSSRRLYWLCKGTCVYMRSSVIMEGCTQGNFKIFIHYVYVFLNTKYFLSR